MKIKVDEDLPRELVRKVAGVIPDTTSVVAQGISGASDNDLWDHVQAEGRFLITGNKGMEILPNDVSPTNSLIPQSGMPK